MKGAVQILIKKNDLPKLSSQAVPKASQIVRKAAIDVWAEADPRTPRDTGNLAGSVTVKMLNETLALVAWGAYYAIYVEFGTRYMAGAFFGTYGAEQVRPGFIKAMEEVFKL